MSDKNFDPAMKDTCELKEAWADGKKLYYVEDIPGLLEQITCLNKQLAKANERVIDSIIEPLYKARWSGDLSDAPVSEMRDQLFKTLRDQTMGYWSGHTAYNIAVDGGFLVNDKKGANKRLTSLGAMFVEQEQLRKGGES